MDLARRFARKCESKFAFDALDLNVLFTLCCFSETGATSIGHILYVVAHRAQLFATPLQLYRGTIIC